MDYDVGIVGLSSPPASATKSTYRPAVSVRNNGIHDALASGVLRIYAAGQLIFTTEVYSPTIPPGETKLAQATDYWTPETEGEYLVIADVSSPLDQYEPNNHLGPTKVTVTGEPPPPPTPVTPHASQHEEDGADELSIDGLKGRAADQQPALAHAASHQAGGSDQVNVSSLIGELASPQTPKEHGNTYHSPSMATSTELADHIAMNPVHSSATNLANRETTGPFTGLLKETQLISGSEVPSNNRQALTRDRRYSYPKHASIGANADLVTVTPLSPETLISMQLPLAWQDATLQVALELQALLHVEPSPGGLLTLSLLTGVDEIATLDIDAAILSDRDAIIRATLLGQSPGKLAASIQWFADSPETLFSLGNFVFVMPGAEVPVTLRATLSSVNPDTFLQVYSGFARSLSPIP